MRFVGGRYIHISEGIRNMKAYIKRVVLWMLHGVVPMIVDSVGNWKATGMGCEEPGAKSVRMGVFCDRKRYGSRQETVTAELKSCGTMYRKESKTGTRLS